MKQEKLYIKKTPALLFGEPSERVFLYIHGQNGVAIAKAHSWQVLSIDLPEHGERQQDKDLLYPWNVVPELQAVMAYGKERWKHIALFANSIGFTRTSN